MQIDATTALHAVSQCLSAPTIALLLLFAAFAVYTLGSFVYEIVAERRHYKVALPALIDDVDAASFDELQGVIQRSGLLESQRERLLSLVGYMHLPEDALTEVAKRLLAEEEKRYRKSLTPVEAASRVAPMLGLMGTLIPLGPGITALSSGDLTTLSSSLLMAFDTTVVGLAVAVVCYLVAKVRRGWYNDYLACLEGVLNTLLEKREILFEQGFSFPERIVSQPSFAKGASDGEE